MSLDFDGERQEMATERADPRFPTTIGASGKVAAPVPDVSDQLVVTEVCSLSLGLCQSSLVLLQIEIGSHMEKGTTELVDGPFGLVLFTLA